MQMDLLLDRDLILVLANKDQYELYRDNLKTFPISEVIYGGVGGHNAINAAIDHIPEGEPVVFMDDDISNIKIWTDIKDSVSRIPVLDLGRTFDYIFDEMASHNQGQIFRIHSGENWTFKTNAPFFEFAPKQIGGMWWGGFNSDLMKTEQSHEDDNIRTSRYLCRDRGCYSFNWISASSSIGLSHGGMQSSLDRGGAGQRKNSTLAACQAALAIPEVAKIYQSEPVWKESMQFYTLKMKNIRDLRKILDSSESRWSSFFQKYPDEKPNISSLEQFF
jgi:hypothetical protein